MVREEERRGLKILTGERERERERDRKGRVGRRWSFLKRKKCTP